MINLNIKIFLNYFQGNNINGGFVFGIISLFNFSFLESGCKPEEKSTVCTNENIVRYPKDAVNRFYFKDSSYWIYEDITNGLFDSIWVYEDSYEVRSIEEISLASKGKCYEGFTMKYKSMIGKGFNVILNCNGPLYGTDYKNERFNIKFYDEKFYFNDAIGMNGNDYIKFDPQYGNVQLLDSLIVNGIKYDNVLSNLNYNSIEPYQFLESYYAADIGLIKYKLRNGSIWNLIRYKINK